MMSDYPDHPVFAKNILEFITVANDFCLQISNIERQKRNKLIDYLLHILPLLYLKTSLLPDMMPANPELNEKFMTLEEYEAIFNSLRNKFGAEDNFYYFDFELSDNEAIKGSLAEHLSDIYQSLNDFLMLYQKNSIDAKENAVAEIKNSFRNYWGFRLVEAHKSLHYLAMRSGSQYHETSPDLL